jgi:N-acetylated-alpha-linked acidic dipeptidase
MKSAIAVFFAALLSAGDGRMAEEKARASIRPENIREYLRRISARPHHAGSPGAKAVSDYIAGLLRAWGFDTRVEEFEVALPTPTVRSLEMIAPHRFQARLQEPPVAQDKQTFDPAQLATYNAYSPAGDVTAPLVYVNLGLPDDYEYLRTQGIEVKGKIVIARYGSAWRGIKPRLAHEHGAIGCILYSDPRDDGYFLGDTFPKGPYRPRDAVQRGSVLDMSWYPGDPLTPGWAAVKGARRLPLAQARSIPRIPVLPISAADARPLLHSLRGPVAPEPWRGALPMTYHIGPGPAKVRLHVEFDWTARPIYDVIGEMRGSQFPDQWLIYGNHHDAWVHGACDPGGGAAALLEAARALGQVRKQGWNPRRTIVIAFWDAEEFGLIGSTEWTEKHAVELDRKAVAYLNTDSNGKGRFIAGGSHLLEPFLAEAARDLKDPATGKPLWQRDQQLAVLGSGSDYTPFLHHLGIASLHLGFSDPALRGVYHSIYDDIYWYEHFPDTQQAYGRALAQLMTTALIRLADAAVLPFDPANLARIMAEYVAELEKADSQHKVNWAALRAEVDKLKHSATRLQPKLASAPAQRLAIVNEKLFRLERALLSTNGLPGRPWYRHRLYAPGAYSGYNGVTLPGIREAMDGQRWDIANGQASELAATLRKLAAELREMEYLW